MFDITRYKKTSMAMTSCDLKSCYDRIAHTPALLATRGFGIPKEPMYSMFHSIQHTQFVTRTAYGDSESTFGGLEEGYIARPQGLGQGNGTGPPTWAVISTRMFEVLREQGMAVENNNVSSNVDMTSEVKNSNNDRIGQKQNKPTWAEIVGK